MSKLQQFQLQEITSKRVIRAATLCGGLGSSNIDKHALEPKECLLEAYSGEYGRSSVHDCSLDASLSEYYVRACKSLTREIATRMIALAEEDLKKVAREARAEAQAVLDAIEAEP